MPDIDVNMDMVLIDASYDEVDLQYLNDKGVETIDMLGKNITSEVSKHLDIKNCLACGELKSGVSPNGATQLWKSAISAVRKVRRKSTTDIKTFIIPSTVCSSIAKDIEHHLAEGDVDKVANLTKIHQLEDICEWLIGI